MVHEYLRSADCVCLNVAHHANIAATDVEVLKLLLGETLHRKLIVTLGRIDDLRADAAAVRTHVATQRQLLATRVLGAHAPEAAQRFLDDTPVLPVCALAALHRARQQRGEELDIHARRMIEDYPTSESDGTADLSRHIRQTLESSARLAGVVGRAEEALNKVVTDAAAALSAAVDDRMLNAGQLAQKAKELAEATATSQQEMKKALDVRVAEARVQWKKRRLDDRERFDSRLDAVALAQLQRAREFVATATADEWRHWRRLRAVADRGTFELGQDVQLRDDIAQNALGGVPPLLRAAIGTILTTATESVRDAELMLEEAARSFAASTVGVAASQLADVRLALREVTTAELRSAMEQYRSDTSRLATTFFEKEAQQKMSQAATDIVRAWIASVRDDSGKGIQSRMHEALESVMMNFVGTLPQRVRDLFGKELDKLFLAAENGAVAVYERVAQKAADFLSERLVQIEAGARRANTTAAATLEAERQVLAQFRERLAASV
jgi:hypothetical protein